MAYIVSLVSLVKTQISVSKNTPTMKQESLKLEESILMTFIRNIQKTAE